MLRIVILTLVTLMGNAFSSNILIAQEIPSASHAIWNTVIGKALSAKGHNVTMLLPDIFKNEKSNKNFHLIFLEGMTEGLEGATRDIITNSIFDNILLFQNDVGIFRCNKAYRTGGFQRIMNYPDNFKFDALLLDITASPCLTVFIQKFKYPPSIGLTAFLLPHFLELDFGNPVQQSYIPGVFMAFADSMSFFERLVNYVMINIDLLLRKYYMKKRIQHLATEMFGANVDNLENLERHISLVLMNLDLVFHYSRPLAPNIIPVGGLHVKRDEILPQDLKKIMDNAEAGVILFSLGTVVTPDVINPRLLGAMTEAFSKLNLTVIWKYNGELNAVPKNVIVMQWVPQAAILAHPNTRLFISHGGGLSTMEAAYYGVPVLGIPFFFDQYPNMIMMENRGIGLKLHHQHVTSDTVYFSIMELLQNPKYTKNMKEMSARMRDQLQTPLERAVYWVEYAIRHNGTHFLNTKARDLPFVVSSSTDVLLFLLVTSCVVLLGAVWAVKLCLARIKNAKRKTD